MRGCLPTGQAHEFHGIVRKDSVFAYESGDIEEPCEAVSPEQYAKLDDVGKQLYQYYEWDDPMEWECHFREILKCVNRNIAAFASVNYLSEITDARIILTIT